MIYFMRICNTGVLLVSNGKVSCDLIRACSDDSHDTYELDTCMNSNLSAAPRLRRRAISSEEDMAQDQRSEERSGYETSGYRETFAAACMVYARFLMLYTI